MFLWFNSLSLLQKVEIWSHGNIRGALCSFGEEIQTHIYSINEVIIGGSQRKIMSSEHCLKLKKWQGPPLINKVKGDQIVLSFKVSLCFQFIQSMKIFPFWFKFLLQNYIMHLQSGLKSCCIVIKTLQWKVYMWVRFKLVDQILKPAYLVHTVCHHRSLK